jgi:hypothetical protein
MVMLQGAGPGVAVGDDFVASAEVMLEPHFGGQGRWQAQNKGQQHQARGSVMHGRPIVVQATGW